jgi:hypothetical protein
MGLLCSPLRLGIMCPASGLSDFARLCIDNIKQDGLAEPVLLILEESQPVPGISEKIKKSFRLDGNLWHVQSKLFPPSRIPAYRLGPLPTDVPRMACKPVRKGRWSQYFTAADVGMIRSHNLDFILKFAFGIIRGDILEAARYGVWSYHHDDEEKYRGGPPAFWEIYKGDPVTSALLQRLTARLDGGIVLKKCHVATNGLSYRKNLQRIHQDSWQMVRWVCVDVQVGRAEYLNSSPSQTSAPIYRAPNDFQMLRFWARLAGNWLRFKLANQRVDVWNVGLVRKPQAAWLDPAFEPEVEWSAYRESGQMVADPFLIPSAAGPRLLAEEFNWSTEKGRISELRWPEAPGKASTMTPVIDEGLHMSYPFIFEHEGGVYAIPECAESNAILLYRLDNESGTWHRERTLIDKIDAVDTTVFRQGDIWWLMHSGRSGCGPWSLYLWYAPSPFGPWESHLANPVKTDICGTRPAGNLFWHQGSLYRPAQDGRTSYGGAVCINRIDELTQVTFRETVVRRIQPDPNGPYPDGIHTLSGFGEWSMVDGKKHRWPLVFLVKRFVVKRLKLKRRDFAYSNVRLAGPVTITRGSISSRQ